MEAAIDGTGQLASCMQVGQRLSLDESPPQPTMPQEALLSQATAQTMGLCREWSCWPIQGQRSFGGAVDPPNQGNGPEEQLQGFSCGSIWSQFHLIFRLLGRITQPECLSRTWTSRQVVPNCLPENPADLNK